MAAKFVIFFLYRKPRAKPAPGYGPAPDRKMYDCSYCDYSGKKVDWLNHLKNDHADKNLVSSICT